MAEADDTVRRALGFASPHTPGLQGPDDEMVGADRPPDSLEGRAGISVTILSLLRRVDSLESSQGSGGAGAVVAPPSLLSGDGTADGQRIIAAASAIPNKTPGSVGGGPGASPEKQYFQALVEVLSTHRNRLE